MSTAFDRAQSHWDSMTPDDGPYFEEKEHLALCFETFECAIAALRASMDTHERMVPREHRELPEIRAKFESFIDLLEEMQVEFGGGGRLFGPKAQRSR